MRSFLFTPMVLILVLAACGGSDSAKPIAVGGESGSASDSVSEDVSEDALEDVSAEDSNDDEEDEYDQIATSVAATFAAEDAAKAQKVAAGENSSDTAGDESGMDEAVEVVVSPEIEIVTGGDGNQAAASETPTVEPTETPSYMPVGSTVVIPDQNVAVTMKNAQFVDSYTSGSQIRETQEGYNYVYMDLELANMGPELRINQSLYGEIVDRDDDSFQCEFGNNWDATEWYDLDNVLPGFSVPFFLACQVPVTAAADGLEGLRAVISLYGRAEYEFDLGDQSGTPTDFSRLREEIQKVSLPVSSDELCTQGSEVPFQIGTARWYDAPGANPPEAYKNLAAEWSDRQPDPDAYNSPWFNEISWVETPEERGQVLTQHWQNLWASVDLSNLDVVVMDIGSSNQAKSDSYNQISYDNFALADFNQTLAKVFRATSGEPYSPILLPFEYLNYQMPPGGEQMSMLYAIVPESAETVSILHRFTCDNSQEYVVIEIPREAYAEAEGEVARPTVPEVEQPATDPDAIEVVVEATQDRTYTGIELQEEQQVTITYLSGQWRPGPAGDWPMVTADGDTRIRNKASFPIPNAALMSLITGVGDPLEQIRSDRPVNIYIQEPGELWFGPNDDNFDDNAGSLVVSVKVNE